MTHRFCAALLATCAACSLTTPALAAPDQPFARQLLEELIASNTAPSGGPDTRHAVGLMVDYLRAAGFGDDEITVVGISEELPSLVVRYRAPDPQAGPVLMMAHIDVVEGLASDWSFPPYVATEDDGWIYGRGSTDNKAGVAMLVANFIQLRREGFVPDRDLILMLTADEETNGFSADMLATSRRDLIDADFALNTDGGGVITGPDGAPLAFVMQTAEKVYATYAFTASDFGGHSSMPKPDNPISAVSRALVALEEYHFSVNLNAISRGFFANWSLVAPQEDRALLETVAAWQPGDPEPEGLAANPYYNSLARTTCVATGLAGGHAENALPQTARAVVNCRILPQETAESVEERLRALVAPYGVNLETVFPYMASPPSLPPDDVTNLATELAVRHFGQIPVIPELSTGATDAAFIRNAGIPVYGLDAILKDPVDDRAHGKDERIHVSAYETAVAYWYDLARTVGTLD